MRKKYVPLLFLAVYLLFIFYITLYSRSFSLIRTCRLELFWSYFQWAKGSADTGKQILLNIALFVPLGYFLLDVLRTWNLKRAGLWTVLISFGITASIETIQYVDGLGLGEADDVFNNVLGAVLGAGIYKLCEYVLGAGNREWYKTWIAAAFLVLGVIGCKMVNPVPLRPIQVLSQLDFAIDDLSLQGNRLMLQGICRAYGQEAPAYQILLRGVSSGRIYKADTVSDGDRFQAMVHAVPDEKAEVLVKFKIYSPWQTSVYINKDRLEYVRGTVKEPETVGTDLEWLVRTGILKVYEPLYDTYVYQFDNKLYWLIGTPLDKQVTVLCYVYTNEPDKLPEKMKKHKLEILNFRAGDNNEITGTIRCGKYRLFEREIPTDYNITAVRTGFYANKKVTWERYFRVR